MKKEKVISIAIVVALVSPLGYLGSIMLMNSQKSKRFQLYAESWMSEKGISHDFKVRLYGNLLWNGNKCLTAVMFKTVTSKTDSASKPEILDSVFTKWEKSDNENISINVFKKTGMKFWDITTGDSVQPAKGVISSYFDLPNGYYLEEWKMALRPS